MGLAWHQCGVYSGSSLWIQGARTTADVSTTAKPAHPESSRTECPVSPHGSKHTFSKRPLFFCCLELSLPSLPPAAQAEDQPLLLFLALRTSPSSSEGKQPALLCITTDLPPDSMGTALTISICLTAVVAVVGQCPLRQRSSDFIFSFQMVLSWSPVKANGFHPGLPEVSPSLLPFSVRPGPLFFRYFFKKELSVSKPCSLTAGCQLLCCGPGGQGLGQSACGPVLAGDEYTRCLLYSPEGALDTSLICLPHSTVQTLAQTPGQPPGLGQRFFVKESQSQFYPCPVEISCLLSIRKQRHTNHPSILFSLNNSVCSLHFF